ncbi:hypothetical protein DCBHLPFO_00621 [Mycoplasmopsis arginini]|uniref:Uncharacterized protein n=1 Tax=Mycoplasmopsis arginini TaxID=2094 RepID=A0AA43QYZ1_MYCAR|nr:hypothetical protein [Mycoplasmopsis arginini]
MAHYLLKKIKLVLSLVLSLILVLDNSKILDLVFSSTGLYNEPQKLDQVIWKNFWGSLYWTLFLLTHLFFTHSKFFY